MAVHIELPLAMPVINPWTGHSSRSFVYRGKVDRVEDGKIIDWKTAADPTAFIRSRQIGFQAECYALAARKAGIHLDQLVYRIIRVPAIRLSNEDIKNARASDRNPVACYEDRATEWILAQGDGLLEHACVINEARLEQAKHWLWSCSKRILDNRRFNRWLPNCNACYTWSRECEYMPLCQAVAAGIDDDWIRDQHFDSVDVVHGELPEFDTDLDTVTFSSLSVLALCDVKYHWRYERRLRKRHDESEPLRIGSAAHVALEAYASGGIDEARSAVDEWMTDNPCLGEEASDRQAVQGAKAMAICRAARTKWSI